MTETKQKIKQCKRCLLDDTVKFIKYDENGICNYCKIHDLLEKKYPTGTQGEEILKSKVAQIKKQGRKNKYDCLVGISGGTDSTYCVYLAKKWGLRPLAVHLDNEWNSEFAVNNIKNAVEKLGVDVKYITVDWEEFKDLQIAFLKASVPDIEIPTDLAIIATLYKVACEENIKWVINGHSFRAEGTTPIGWTYMDGKYINSVYKQHGIRKKIKTFTNLTLSKLLYYMFIKRINFLEPLEYMDYDKKTAQTILKNELGWQSYGGHHFESTYTRFVMTHILYQKFKIDKRKAYLSGPVRAGMMTKQEAIEIMKSPPLPANDIIEDKKYVLKKFDMTEEEFESIMKLPIKSFLDYKTYYPTIKRMRFPIKMATKLNLLPEILYLKYGGGS